MVSAFPDRNFTFEADAAFDFEMILRWTIYVRPMKGKTQHNHNVNNTATRNIHDGYNLMFSGNIFGGTFNIDIIKVKRKIKNSPPPPPPPPKKNKALEDNMTPTVNKCVKYNNNIFNNNNTDPVNYNEINIYNNNKNFNDNNAVPINCLLHFQALALGINQSNNNNNGIEAEVNLKIDIFKLFGVSLQIKVLEIGWK